MIVGTWNMQGSGNSESTSNFSDVIGQMRNGVHTFCLQECGDLPVADELSQSMIGNCNVLIGVVSAGTERSQFNYFCIYYNTKFNGQAKHDRCSMAVLTTVPKGTLCGVVEHPSGTIRPLVGVVTDADHWVYSIHAPARSGHAAAAGVADSMLRIIDPREKYICAGDYNCPPSLMETKGYSPVATDNPTQQSGGNTLDYAIGANLNVNLCASSDKKFSPLVSDHYSQYFEVN